MSTGRLEKGKLQNKGCVPLSWGPHLWQQGHVDVVWDGWMDRGWGGGGGGGVPKLTPWQVLTSSRWLYDHKVGHVGTRTVCWENITTHVQFRFNYIEGGSLADGGGGGVHTGPSMLMCAINKWNKWMCICKKEFRSLGRFCILHSQQ